MSGNFIGMNPTKPFPSARAKELSTARGLAKQAKTNAMGTIGQFQQLDGAKNADNTPIDVNAATDVVAVQTPVELPKTAMEQFQEKMKAPDAENPTPSKMVMGQSRQDSQGLAEGAITVAQGDKTDAFQYQKTDDGTEVYHAPTAEGYAVVRENKNQGTLFVELSEGPNFESFAYASSPEFKAPDLANDGPQEKGKLSDLLDMTDGRTAQGTYLEGVQQRFGILGNVAKSIFGGGKKE